MVNGENRIRQYFCTHGQISAICFIVEILVLSVPLYIVFARLLPTGFNRGHTHRARLNKHSKSSKWPMASSGDPAWCCFDSLMIVIMIDVAENGICNLPIESIASLACFFNTRYQRNGANCIPPATEQCWDSREGEDLPRRGCYIRKIPKEGIIKA